MNMAKDNRRDIDKYTNLDYAGEVLKQLCPTIGALLKAIEANLMPTETIDVTEWYGERFYIEVKDSRNFETKYPSDKHVVAMRCGFTVNIKTDEIMWNDDKRYNPSGGNCFLRSQKWRAFVNRYFAGTVTPEMMYFYKYVYAKAEPQPLRGITPM